MENPLWRPLMEKSRKNKKKKSPLVVVDRPIWQWQHLSTIVDMSSLSPGHQTDILARSRLMTIPGCPSCIRSRISCHIEFGTTMRSSYTSNSSAIDR